MSNGRLIVSRRALLATLAALAIVVATGAAILAGPRALTALFPRAVAPASVVAQQRVAAEHSVQRGFAKAIDQLDKVRALTLAISVGEADQIDAKARSDLRDLRGQALRAIGQGVGIGAPSLDAYVANTGGALDRAGALEDEPGVLLAPELFAVVRRADELLAQIADTATRELTRAPKAPSPTAQPPSPSVRPSPSPTGR